VIFCIISGTCKSDEMQLFHEICKAIKGSCKRKSLLDAIKEAELNPDVPYIPVPVATPKKGLTKKKTGAQASMLYSKSITKNLLKLNLLISTANEDAEEDEAEKDEESHEEEEEEDVKKTPQRKSKTPKAAVQKRSAKSMKQADFEDEDQMSDDTPVPSKKMKIRKSPVSLPTYIPNHPALLKRKSKAKEVSSDEESEVAVLDVKEEPTKADIVMGFLFIYFREPEDENMPEDERIVRRLIKSAVWECVSDSIALATILRRMRQYFSEDKIKNWDQDELLESIEAERTRSIEKIEECLVMKDWKLQNIDEIIRKEESKAKIFEASDDSDEDEDMDDEKVFKLVYFILENGLTL